MFQIRPHADGFQITWDRSDLSAAGDLLEELLLDGVQRKAEWDGGVVIERYRNAFETLGQVTEVCRRTGIQLEYDDEVRQFLTQAGVESKLFAEIIGGGRLERNLPSSMPEFPVRRLLHYQVSAVSRHLRNQHSADFSVPGAGKTSVALALWAIYKREFPDLGLWVIGPLSCFRPWEDEYAECFGCPPVAQRVRGTHTQRMAAIRRAEECELALCTYQTAWREEDAIAAALGSRPWMLVLDEAHYVKSMNGKLSGAVRNLAPLAFRRLLLTGTPMPRSPVDVWSLFTFLWPAVTPLGNAQQFELQCRDRPLAQLCDELSERVRPLFHRTCKHDLELPPVDFRDHAIDPRDVPASQRLVIRLVETRTVQEAQFLSPRDRQHLKRWRRARVIRLMQAASNPELLADALSWEDIEDSAADPDHESEPDLELVDLRDNRSSLAQALRRYRERKSVPAKASYVADRCRALATAGKKVVIWAHFRKNVDLLAELLRDLRPLCITGEVPAYEAEDDEDSEETREQRIAIFKSDPKRRILIASASACAESISLHRVCQHAVYFERSFNAAHFLQSVDRIHRQGMPPNTTAHVEIPYIPCAIERVVNRRLQLRQAQLYKLLNDPMPVIGFDDESQAGFFDLVDFEGIDELFEEVLAEIRGPRG